MAAELVADCPRCGAQRITFEVKATHVIGESYGWQRHYEAFGICRQCDRATVFGLSQKTGTDYEYVHKTGLLKVEGALNKWVEVDGYVSLKDEATIAPPEHIPNPMIESAFREGATCYAVDCSNAAGTMFRLCIDLATKPLLPKEDAEGEKPNRDQRRKLGLRLKWLFEHGLLDRSLEDLSSCIKDDGDDAAHTGKLTEEDAADLLDFTRLLLGRMFTEPKRLELAKGRRAERRGKK